MPSFDVVSEIDKPELSNAINQANKELNTRFDFKGTDARVEQSDNRCLLYTSPSPRDRQKSRMPSSA